MSFDPHHERRRDAEEHREEDADAPALGSDPFEELPGPDPFLDAMVALGGRGEAGPGDAGSVLPLSGRAGGDPPAWQGWHDVARAVAASEAPVERPMPAMPALSEVEVPAPEGWAERLLEPDVRRRLAALSHLVDGEEACDRYGLSPAAVRRSFPFFYGIYRGWFRVRSQGAGNIPADGPVVLAANHGGLLPFDGAMLVLDVFLHTDPPRLPRAVVDRWAGTLPWVNVYYARVGQIIGTRENCAGLLEDGHVLLVFPEGMNGVRKPFSQRGRLQPFRVGFIEQALRARAPVVPAAVIGSDYQAPILHDFKSLAKAVGLPTLPVTPTFPWLGPLGLLPYPVRYGIVYGEPLPFHERYGPEDADDARLVRFLASQVRVEVQRLLDAGA